jgi:hypothetical protein
MPGLDSNQRRAVRISIESNVAASRANSAPNRYSRDEEAMSSTVWQAFYFHGRDNAHSPARTELIEAATEDDAAKVAVSHMGRCKRVDISGPRWEPRRGQVILAEGGRCETGPA